VSQSATPYNLVLGDRKNFSEVSNFAEGLPEGVQRYVEWQSLEVAKSTNKKKTIKKIVFFRFFIHK